jgi:hypothetical protein
VSDSEDDRLWLLAAVLGAEFPTEIGLKLWSPVVLPADDSPINLNCNKYFQNIFTKTGTLKI